jgi:hypothetical protein
MLAGSNEKISIAYLWKILKEIIEIVQLDEGWEAIHPIVR